MASDSEIRVCMDIGAHHHSVVIGLSSGEVLKKFDISHTTSDIEKFFLEIAGYEAQYQCPVSIAMEAYNGYARPIDQYALSKGYKLFNVNNHKLAQFKKIFPGPAKTDEIDSQKIFELFHLQSHLPLAKNVLQEVVEAPEINRKLKRLTRRRQILIEEKKRTTHRLHADIQAVSPGLLRITNCISNAWFLNFMTSRSCLTQLARMQPKSLAKIKGVGLKYQEIIESWQSHASFSSDIDFVGGMIIRDAQRILELKEELKRLEQLITSLIDSSELAARIQTITGFGIISAATLAGEIGTIERFKNESGLALYLGMAVLDNSSGSYTGTKTFRHVNKQAKGAMMHAVARHIDYCSESKKYYDKKRQEGKKHNQAVRSMGRHLVRVMWSMLRNQRDYQLR